MAGMMEQSEFKDSYQNKALQGFVMGGVCGLGAALAFAAAIVLALAGGAFGQDNRDARAAIAASLAECEAAAFSGDDSGRAIGACDSALRSSDLSEATRARTLANRGVIAVRRGEAGAALSDLEEAVRLDPAMPEAWLSLSAARIGANRLNGAIEAAQTALSLEIAQPALAHFNIAIAHETAGRLDLAYEAYVLAAQLDPDNQTLRAQPRRFLRHQAG